MPKITAYTALSGLSPTDVLPVVDVSDTTMAPTGTTKRITVASLAPSFGGLALTPSGDTTGATDIVAVNNALAAAGPGGLVELVDGQWYLNHPIVIPTGVQLAGYKGGINGGSASSPTGTVLNPVAGFTQGSAPQNAVISMAEVSSSVSSLGCRIRDLAIQGVAAPSGVDGIACNGAVNGLSIHGVSMNQVPHRGIAWYTSGAGNDADGFWGDRIMLQRCGYTGFYRLPSDSNLHSCHVQYPGNVSNASGPDGAGFYCSNGGNTRFVGCRADLSLGGSGFYLDHFGGAGGFTDAITLSACGTQRNAHHGLHATNSSAAGTQWRDPIVISGCTFDEDGHNGGSGGNFAGIFAEGQNIIFISGTTVTQGTLDLAAGCPKYGLLTGTTGTAPAGPQIITWAGGFINYSTVTGGLPYLDSGNTNFLYFSPDMTAIAGYDGTGVSARQGSVTLSGGTATVTSPWVTSTARTFVSIVSPGVLANIGTPYVSSRSAGSMTIKSTNASDSSTVAWQITGS